MAENIKKIVIIIPTYNEAEIISETIVKVFKATATIQNKSIHILVFDSASTDNTQQIVTNLQETYKCLHLKTEQQKSGLGSAYMQAMRYAIDSLAADIVMEFDADLSHQPHYIAPMLEKLQTHDVVIGSRYVPGGRIPKHWGWHRRLLSVLGNVLARLILTPKYKDWTSGFRATKSRSLALALPKQFISNGYAYKLQLFWELHKSNARIYEYPIEFVDRNKGKSKLPNNSIFDSLKLLFLLRFMKFKSYFHMCLVGFVGMVLQLAVYNLLRQQNIPPVHAAQLAVLTAIVNNFILNSRYTFKKITFFNVYQKIKAFTIFTAYSIWMVYLQSYWVELMTSYVGHGALNENIILIAGIAIASILNYLSYSRLIWPKKYKEKEINNF